MTLTTKLMTAFALMVTLLILTAGMALYELHVADQAASAVSHQSLPAILHIGETSAHLERVRRIELAATTFTDPAAVARYQHDLDESMAAFDRSLSAFAALPQSPDEAAIVRSMGENWQSYAACARATLAAQTTGHGDDARRSLAAGRDAFLRMDPEVLELLRINREQADRASAHEAAAVQIAYRVTGCLAVASIVIGLVVAWVLSRHITRPIVAVHDALAGLAQGDLRRRVAVAGHDELAAMAAMLNRTMDDLRGTVGSIVQSAQGVAGAAEELTTVSQQLTGHADTASAQSSQAAAAANQVAASITTMASGVEELGTSVEEIAKNTTAAAQVGRDGVAATATADQAMGRLSAASSEIGGIVKIIADIAEQTNLLALNATIEAARAGDAGRGFAVVASEVKDLAHRSGEATHDIGKRIAAIQTEAGAAQTALLHIREIVDRINQMQQSIASAVEEQSATTRDLSGHVSQVAQAGTGIASNAAAVAVASRASADGAVEGQRAAHGLAKLAAGLRESIARFTV